MNKTRREKLSQTNDLLNEVISNFRDILWEEQDSFDAVPENLQSSYKGEQMELCIEHLESAISSLEEALEEATTALTCE